MTFEELLNLSAEEISILTDERLLEILSPSLKDCPPIELVIIQKKAEDERLLKESKKMDIKSAKQLDRVAKKNPQLLLDQLNKLMEGLK